MYFLKNFSKLILNKKIFFIFNLFFLFFIITTNNIFAQQDSDYNIILNWTVYNLFPNFYLNKNLPTPGSDIEIGLILLKNNKIIDLNNYLIQWFVDNELFKEDYGLTKINFKIKKSVNSYYIINVKIIINDDKKIQKNIIINIKKPKISLEYFIENNDLILKSWPFFFNAEDIKNLKFNWLINNQNFSFEGDNELIIKNYKELNLNNINITHTITNIKNFLESITIKKNIKINE